MSEITQINVTDGNKVVRIYSGWGMPNNILPALKAAAKVGRSQLIDIAHEIIRQVPDASFGLRIIPKDEPYENLIYLYSADVSSTPWRVGIIKMPHYRLMGFGDEVDEFEPFADYGPPEFIFCDYKPTDEQLRALNELEEKTFKSKEIAPDKNKEEDEKEVSKP